MATRGCRLLMWAIDPGQGVGIPIGKRMIPARALSARKNNQDVDRLYGTCSACVPPSRRSNYHC